MTEHRDHHKPEPHTDHHKHPSNHGKSEDPAKTIRDLDKANQANQKAEHPLHDTNAEDVG